MIETPHLADGWWAIVRSWAGYTPVLWQWDWLGRKNEPTVYCEASSKLTPKAPPRFVSTYDPNLPGAVPHNL